MVGEQEAAYALKCYLSNVAFDIIRNEDDDLREMWQRLDDGNPSKLIDVVVNDIKRLRSIHEEDERRLLHFIDISELGYRDLLCMKLQTTQSNNTVVSLIEKKLPRYIG